MRLPGVVNRDAVLTRAACFSCGMLFFVFSANLFTDPHRLIE